MRRVLIALVCLSGLALLPGSAVAQQPMQLSLGGGNPFALGAPAGPVRYVTEDVAAVRFLGEEIAGPSLAAGDQVELVYEEGGWVRIRKAGAPAAGQASSFGWVPAAKLAESPPADEAAASAVLGSAGSEGSPASE